MNLPVFWTDEATETFDSIINLIENNWGLSSASKFVSITYRKIGLLKKQPYMFKASISTNIRQAIITKQTSMFYEVYADHIIVLFFWDNRQDPIL